MQNVKSVLILLLLAWSTSSLAQVAARDSWVIARGALKDCEAWTWRILDIEQVGETGSVELLGLPPVAVTGLGGSEILDALLAAIESATGSRPSTLHVSVENGVRLTRDTFEQYKASLLLMGAGRCPESPESLQDRVPASKGRGFDGIDNLEREIQEMEYRKLLESLA